MKRKIKSVLALKEIVEKDYEDYVRTNAINGTIVGGISDGEYAEEPLKPEKEKIHERVSADFNLKVETNGIQSPVQKNDDLDSELKDDPFFSQQPPEKHSSNEDDK